ncbi:hypothetical protein [Burkholderia vietnamiensis]|uniref:hypothetical protein n=1 Tax=Burkholderia vietnamiensis TaxID=60552 RepID=UPI001E350552|nr:hypothetical protein [Burkholderia vietnamiensis]
MHLTSPLDPHVVVVVDHDFGNVGRFQRAGQLVERREKQLHRVVFERTDLEQLLRSDLRGRARRRHISHRTCDRGLMRGWRILGNFGHAAIVQAARAADGPKEWQNSTAFVAPQTAAFATVQMRVRVNRLRGLTGKAPEKRIAFS